MPIRLRALEPGDLDTLYEAENDEGARASSDNIAPYSRHILAEYIATTISRPDDEHQLRLIAEDTDSGKTVGILDFYDISMLHRRAFIGIYVLEEARLRGFGSLMLEEAALYAANTLGLSRLAARILETNDSSIRLFSRNGYTEIATLPKWHFADGRFNNVHLFMLDLSE